MAVEGRENKEAIGQLPSLPFLQRSSPLRMEILESGEDRKKRVPPWVLSPSASLPSPPPTESTVPTDTAVCVCVCVFHLSHG